MTIAKNGFTIWKKGSDNSTEESQSRESRNLPASYRTSDAPRDTTEINEFYLKETTLRTSTIESAELS